ncbi:hypothetical protein GQ457_08G026080 [Hibiscus cannabinus]
MLTRSRPCVGMVRTSMPLLPKFCSLPYPHWLPLVQLPPPRVSKHSMQGKYEVCTLIQPERTDLHPPHRCSDSNSDGNDVGMSSLNSSMEASEQQVFLSTKREHKSLLDKEEQYWAQCSWVNWLWHGDHKQAEVANLVVRYFETLFTSSQPEPSSTLLDLITPFVDSLMNGTSLLPFTDDEILYAFQDIDLCKAPDIDGLPGSFYRQQWDLTGQDILHLCHSLISHRIDMTLVNKMVIALISKVKDLVRMKQLCPISLCMVVYKIVSKVLGLSASLHAEQRAGRIKGIKASQQGPHITHLLYSDDNIVFIQNSPQEASRPCGDPMLISRLFGSTYQLSEILNLL